jgi:hypothetical protein
VENWDRKALGEETLAQDLDSWTLLENAKYLYLRTIAEPRDNSLLLVVQESAVNQVRDLPEQNRDGSPAQALRETRALMNTLHPIESTNDCRTFELYWKRYAAYLVTEECVGSSGKYEDEVYTGRLLRRYEKSHFLNHLANDTGGHFQPLKHYKLVCLNHLVDVAAEDAPEVRLAKSAVGAGLVR